jgi:quinol monooxygenase YgiN
MINALVRYRVKPGRATENEQLIARVFEQLEREKPNGLRYSVFKLPDGVSFVHVVIDDAADGTSTLTKLSAFREFTAALDDRIEEPRVRTALELISSYAPSKP